MDTEPATELVTRVQPFAPAPPPRRIRAWQWLAIVLCGAVAGGGMRAWQLASEVEVEVAPRYRCWDGTVVDGGRRCDVADFRAQFWAFGLPEARCSVDPISGKDHNTTSYRCTLDGVVVHVASYESFDARGRRMGEYGPRTDLGGGRVFAGGPDQRVPRYLRTYDGPSARQGLLMYVSVTAEPHALEVLNGLRQRSADELLYGEPVVGE